MAEEAPALAGHVVRDVDRLLDVAARLGLHLPHLARHQIGERGLLLLEQPREAEEDLAALRSRHEPPFCERLLRDRYGAVDVLDAGARKNADRLACGGARALEGLAGGGIDPLAADEVLEVRRRSRRHAASLAHVSSEELRSWLAAKELRQRESAVSLWLRAVGLCVGLCGSSACSSTPQRVRNARTKRAPRAGG